MPPRLSVAPLALLLACGPKQVGRHHLEVEVPKVSPARPPPERCEPPLPDFLAGTGVFPLRARPAAEDASFLEIVAIDDGPSPRLLLQGDGVWVAPRARSEQLAWVARVDTKLSVERGAMSSPEGLYLRAGTVLTLHDGVDRDPVSATYRDDTGVSARGFVPRHAIGHTFVPAAKLPPIACDSTLLDGTFHTEPGGGLLVRCPSCGPCAQRTSSPRQGYVRVHASNGHAEVIGWVLEASLGASTPMHQARLPHVTIGHAHRRPADGFPLPERTRLYNRPGGQVIGVAREETTLHHVGDVEGWAQLTFHGPLGPIAVYARLSAKGRAR